MQVIGLCRFSYLGRGGFQVDFPSVAEKQAYLFAPERMEERFRSFETIMLPAMRAQTDPDFTLLVVTSQDLPPQYRMRLESALSDIPQVVLKDYPPRPHREIMQKAVNSVRQNSGSPCLQFRMDDDDAVAVDFVERLRASAEEAHPIIAARRHVAIDFNKGYSAEPGPDGLRAIATQLPFQTAALAIAFAPDVKLSILNFAHNRLPQLMTTISHADQDMLVRGLTPYNDSRQGAHVQQPKLALLDAEGEAHFKARFNIDSDAVRAAWRV